jgi:hypothetical protein
MDNEKMNMSMVSIMAILESQIIPGITLNKAVARRAVLALYILFAISYMTRSEITENVTDTNLAAKTLTPPKKKKIDVTTSKAGG